MDYKKDIIKLINQLKEADIDRAQIEADLNVGNNYLDQVLARGGNAKAFNKLKMYAELKLQNAIASNLPDSKTKDIKQNTSFGSIESLSESNRLLAESHLKLVETNSELTALLKGILNPVTANVPLNNQPVFDARLEALLEVVAGLGVGKDWKSKQEGIATLHKKVYHDPGKVKR